MIIQTFTPFGYEGSMVTVEVDLRKGIPAVDIVGLADSEVSSFRERLRSAFKNQGLEFPSERVLISLSPADIKKEGSGYELPVALAILAAQNNLTLNEKVFCMGELQLSGKTRGSLCGTYAALQTAVANGFKYAIIPDGTEVAVPKGITVYKVENLPEAYSKLSIICNGFAKVSDVAFPPIPFEEHSLDTLTEKDYSGIEWLKFGMMIAAAGRHNILAVGGHGGGKTEALKLMGELTPNLTEEEAESVMRIHSLAGIMHFTNSISKRPFRAPNATTTVEGMCGGGANCRPGEISLAHNGMLFLDDAAEFKTSVLQMLRVPLESGSITLSRAGRNTTYPADFQLLMTTQSCPCGNYGSKERVCLCSGRSIDQYWRKFSAPLLDRVDIRINMFEPGNQKGWTVEEMRAAVGRAFKAQLDRQGKFNSALTPNEIEEYIVLDDTCRDILDKARVKYGFSFRAISSIMKLARTYSDIFGEEKISEAAIKTAIDLRKPVNDYSF